MIDEEISKLVESAYNEALRILTENKEGLIQLAEKLLDKEVIFSEDVENIFGKRPWAVEERNFTKTDEDSETKKMRLKQMKPIVKKIMPESLTMKRRLR